MQDRLQVVCPFICISHPAVTEQFAVHAYGGERGLQFVGDVGYEGGFLYRLLVALAGLGNQQGGPADDADHEDADEQAGDKGKALAESCPVAEARPVDRHVVEGQGGTDLQYLIRLHVFGNFTFADIMDGFPVLVLEGDNRAGRPGGLERASQAAEQGDQLELDPVAQGLVFRMNIAQQVLIVLVKPGSPAFRDPGRVAVFCGRRGHLALQLGEFVDGAVGLDPRVTDRAVRQLLLVIAVDLLGRPAPSLYALTGILLGRQALLRGLVHFGGLGDLDPGNIFPRAFDPGYATLEQGIVALDKAFFFPVENLRGGGEQQGPVFFADKDISDQGVLRLHRDQGFRQCVQRGFPEGFH